MAGAGGLVALLLGVEGTGGQALVIAVVGVLMIALRAGRRHEGHHLGADHQGVLLIIGAAIMTFWVLAKYGLNLSDLLGGAVDKAAPRASRGAPRARRAVRRQHARPSSTSSRSSLALVLGTAGLPHVLMRFYTVPTAKEARRSVVWAIWLIGIFYLFTPGAGVRRGRAGRPGGDQGGARRRELRGTAARLRAGRHGPAGLISAVAFATILAVVAGLTITAAASFAHDIYASVIKHGRDHAGRRGEGRPASPWS